MPGPAQHPGPPGTDDDGAQADLLEVLPLGVGNLGRVQVHRGAVPLVEVVGATDVVGVRVGDEEGDEVLGAGADVPHGGLDAAGVCGVPGVDQVTARPSRSRYQFTWLPRTRNTPSATSLMS